MSFYEKGQRARAIERAVMMKGEEREEGRKGKERVWAVGFEDGERGHKPRKVGDPWKLETVRKGILPWNQKELASQHLDVSKTCAGLCTLRTVRLHTCVVLSL